VAQTPESGWLNLGEIRWLNLGEIQQGDDSGAFLLWESGRTGSTSLAVT